MLKALQYGFVLFFCALLAGCGTREPYTLNLMPVPEVFDETLTPFQDISVLEKAPYHGILYVTDRLQSDGERHQERYYQNERSPVVFAGTGNIETRGKEFSWDELIEVSLLKNRPSQYPLQVSGINEIGVLSYSVHELVEEDQIPADPEAAEQKFKSLINEKLAISKDKDVYIYVHGYKVIFENPLLVSTEIWHFLGYDGVFIAYAWPSTPNRWAYFADLETATYTARNLRLLLKFLQEETDVERINIIGYSAGTRVVLDALAQLTYQHLDEERQGLTRKLRLGDVVLTGSDYDRWVFFGMLIDGMLDLVDSLTIYESTTDKALGLSEWFLGRERLGQLVKRTEPSEAGKRFFLTRLQRRFPHSASFLEL